jgi:hypothetical protein
MVVVMLLVATAAAHTLIGDGNSVADPILSTYKKTKQKGQTCVSLV